MEIVGIDTANMDSVKIYAWTWLQQFKTTKDSIPYASLGKITASEFVVLGGGRDYKVIAAFVADENSPLREQLEQRQFPEDLIKKYFIKQAESVEVERIKALSQKAEEKYKMYRENSYLLSGQPTQLPVAQE